MRAESAKLNMEGACRQDPHALLGLRCREAEARSLNGEVLVRVKYRDGRKTGVEACVTESYK